MRLLPAIAVVLAGCTCADPAPAPEPVVLPEDKPPDVILVVVDTLRRDHLDLYGHTSPTTPELRRLAADGVRYDRAWSTAPWTTPSIGAMLTGQLPSTLGIRDQRVQLPDRFELLSEVASEQGYRTAAVVSHSYCNAQWNFDQGFGSFDESNIAQPMVVTSPGVTDAAIAAVDAAGVEPLLLFVHYFDPHFPYLEHDGFPMQGPEGYTGPIRSGTKITQLRKLQDGLGADDLDELRRLYDSEIGQTDQQIGRLLDHLRASGRYDDALIVVTADHGEGFREHGHIGHTVDLYEENVRAPLVVKYPDGRTGTDEAPASLLDLYPTVLEVLGWSTEQPLQGTSLLAERPDDRPIFAETRRGADLRMVVSDGHKLVHDRKRDRVALYDLSADPGEQQDLAADPAQTERVASLRAALEAWPEEGDSGAAVELTDDEVERLRALGYVEE